MNTVKRPIISSISIKVQLYSKETGVMGRLVKIRFSCHTLAVCPGSRPYVHHVTIGRTSGHEIVRPL